ncbi:MAG: glycosyltransferase family 9 protein [bacterium]|nr:glycosyltransferase family 9 protein [bacterium]
MDDVLEIKPGDRILVSRSDRLGDLILALPFVETLKARYPECQVDVLASLYASPILENNERIGGIVRVQNDQLVTSRHYRKELEQKIRKAGYQVVVALYPERHICRLFHQLRIPHRVGTAGRFHSVFFNHRLMHSRKANKKHESEYNQDFLKYFKAGPTITTPRVHSTEKEVGHARNLLLKWGIGGAFVVVHPGSGGSADRWPMERFIEFYRDLENAGIPTIITGSEEEGRQINKTAEDMGIKPKEITGETDLRTLAAVLSQASLVVANSTGPLHLAVAVGTRVVGLYPRRKIMSPVRWGPVGDGHQVIQPLDPDCQCPPRQCHCMDTITVSRVTEAAREVYGRRAG